LNKHNAEQYYRPRLSIERKEGISMARTFKDASQGKAGRGRGGRARQRHISVRSIRRDPPDLRKLSRAVIALAMAQADAEVQAAHDDHDRAEDGTGATQCPEESSDDA
jgi:hypothetical protein